jgi:carboxymethylenebutenolidase
MSCTYCYKGFALPGEPKGTIVGRDYFTAAPNDATQRTKAIVLLTDIFGLPLPNPRIVADHLAEQVGVDVWVPDYFNGASLITLTLVQWLVGWLVGWLADFEPLLPRSGKPPADVNSLEPLMPDRAGAKTPWLDILKLIFKIIPLLPGIIANRVSVVDPRVHEVGDPLRRVLFGLVH